MSGIMLHSPAAPKMPDASEPPFVVLFKKPRLFGRDRLLELLHEELQNESAPQKLALTGQGGIGKTQLAALYVHTYRSAYTGGIFWLDLANPKPREILRQIAGSFAPKLDCESSLENEEARDRDLAEKWIAKVRNRCGTLIVADNLEQPELLAQLADLPSSSLIAFDCCLLVTSQQRNLPGCQDIPVERLPLSPARELLLTEASRHLGGLDQDERDAVGRVCNMLGGLPLTLRLAGALVREEAATFTSLAEDLAERGVIEILDSEPCPLEDYKRNVARALTRLIEESLDSIPRHKAEWLDLLKTVALFPKGSILKTDFLRCFVRLPAARIKGGDGFARALAELYRRNLIEHPDEERAAVRLHPLLHEYVKKQVDDRHVLSALEQGRSILLEPRYLRSRSGENLIELAGDLARLPGPTSTAADDDPRVLLTGFRRVIERRAHQLRAGSQPLVQLHYQAFCDRHEVLAHSFDAAAADSEPRFRIFWSTSATDAALARIFLGHEDGVSTCAFSPDGRHALSGSRDRTLILWDVERGAGIRRFQGHEESVRACAFGPDGRRALSASYDGWLFLWDVTRGEEIRRFQHQGGGVWSSAFGPDGQHALSASLDGTLILWDVEQGEEIRRFQGHEVWVTACAFGPDGRRALSASYDGWLFLWDVTRGEEIRRFQHQGGGVFSSAFSPDGQHALSASFDGTLILWDVEQGKEIRRLRGQGCGASSCVFRRDWRGVLLSWHFGELVLWDLEHGNEIRRLHGHQDTVTTCALSPDWQHVLSASEDRTLILWDLERGSRENRKRQGHMSGVMACAFSPDGRRALSATGFGELILWDVERGEAIRRTSSRRGAVMHGALGPDGRWALLGFVVGPPSLWDVARGEEIRRFQGHEDSVTACAFSPDGRRALFASHDGWLFLWDVERGEEIRRFQHQGGGVLSSAFSPDGQHALSASLDGTLILWDVERGEEIRRFQCQGGKVMSCASSSERWWALSTSEDHTLVIWDVEQGKLIAQIGLQGLAAAALAPDGRRVMVGERTGDISCFEIVRP